jgi:hypothetical protein
MCKTIVEAGIRMFIIIIMMSINPFGLVGCDVDDNDDKPVWPTWAVCGLCGRPLRGARCQRHTTNRTQPSIEASYKSA